MPNDFITTRTPGSRTSTYGLADHIADTNANPHPQYLLKDDYITDGAVTDGKLEAHIKDPNAHSGVLATIQMLNDYLLTEEFSTILSSHLYHDYAADGSKSHAASMSAVNGAYAAAMTAVSDAYNSALTALAEHTKDYDQNAAVTGHRDSTNQELYAHRVHTHTLEELGGATALIPDLDKRYSLIGHNHDDRYSQLGHTHNYLTQEDLELVGIYPNTTIGTNGTDTSTGEITDPFDFNEETQQGNVSISPTLMTSALNKPDITTPGTTSFLNIITEITSADKDDEEGNTIYGERSCSQTLTTDGGIYYRIGHRASGSLTTGQDELSLWTWSAWQPIGGGAKDIFEVFYSVTTAVPRGAFPLWTGETLTNCRTLYPTFYQKALDYQASGKIRVVDVSTYDNEVATYGECGAFVIDTNTGSIRLPKITSYISSIEAASSIGTTLPAGLPNITGTFGGVSRRANNRITPTGAFTSLRERFDWGPSGDEASYANEIQFDASNSNSAYGSSNTVQPPSVCLALYIQVYNTVTASAITDLDARVGVLEQNAIMFARHDFISSSWKQNTSTQLYEYTFNTNHFTSSHIYMNETGGSVLVDESVEVHIVGSTEAGDIDRRVKLVAPQAFTGYIITLG